MELKKLASAIPSTKCRRGNGSDDAGVRCVWVAVKWADMTLDDEKSYNLDAANRNPASSVFLGPVYQAIMPSKLGRWAFHLGNAR